MISISLNAKELAIVGPDEVQFPQTLLKRVASELGYAISYPYADMPKGQLSVERQKKDLDSGSLDVFWSMTNQSLEDELQAIKVPVFRGLFGLRIALIKAEHADRFRNITRISELNRFSAGSGKDWPDTDILKHNQLSLVTTLKYHNMFPMLEGERFDYFPRGLNEPWGEVERHAELNLVVDQHIMFRYVSPVYFFVKKGSPLARDIESTLISMVDSGEYQRLFFADTEVKKALDSAQVTNRVIFELENPNLPAGTPVANKSLWFDPINDIEGQ